MKKFLTIAAAILTLSLGACASESRPTAMVPHGGIKYTALAGSSLRNNLVVDTVTGGKTTNPMWTSQVSSTAFEQALRQTLEENGYFAQGKAGRYLVRADLMRLDQPLLGLTFDVTSTVEYTVQDRNSRSTKYQRTITETGTATFGDSAMAVERLRLANEHSIQNNLKAFLGDLRRLK